MKVASTEATRTEASILKLRWMGVGGERCFDVGMTVMSLDAKSVNAGKVRCAFVGLRK